MSRFHWKSMRSRIATWQRRNAGSETSGKHFSGTSLPAGRRGRPSADARRFAAFVLRAALGDRRRQHGRLALFAGSRLPDFVAHHGLNDARLVREPVRELIALGRVRNRRRDREHLVQKRAPALRPLHVVPGRRAVQRTMPVSTVLMTAPGVPMIWNGQEVGWGYGLGGSKEARNRSTINWNYQGKGVLTPHYQKLAWIRADFPAFTQHKRDTNHDGAVSGSDSSDFVRVTSSNGSVYAFLRPYQDQNGLTVVNAASTAQDAVLDLSPALILAKTGLVYLNDLYGGGRRLVPVSSLSAVTVSLPPYGSAVYTVSVTPDSLRALNPLLAAPVRDRETPAEFALGPPTATPRELRARRPRGRPLPAARARAQAGQAR